MKGFIAKSTLILSLALVMTACKIAVMVPSGGNVVSLSGARNCAGADFCEFEIVSTPFSESFTAQPKPGYEFEKWSDGGKFQCANSTNPTCTINIADDSLGASIVALFDTAYMMPVFKDIGIDTDDDGVRNELDEDDDGDGLNDSVDPCPLISDTSCSVTDFSGIISENTTWSGANGPINLTGIVQISPGVTLTILEGAIITNSGNCNADKLEVFGSLVIQGSEQNPVEFPKGLDLTASGAANPSIHVNFANIRYVSSSCIASRLSISSLVTFSLTNSILERVNGSFASSDFEAIFEKNVVGPGSYFELNRYGSSGDGQLTFRNNIFNEAVVALSGSINRLVFENNTLISKPGSEAIALFNQVSDPAGYNLPNNYWGTNDTEVVDAMIRDRSDNLNIPGYVTYTPILSEPHPDTPTGL